MNKEGLQNSTKEEKMIIRSLEEEDFDKGFLEVLEHLTTVGDVSREEFEQQWRGVMYNIDHCVYVAEKDGQVVGAATLLVERKFIHKCGLVGHVEDVVTDKQYEGQGIGGALVRQLIDIAKRKGCYKVILDCADELIPFYEKFGFQRKENQMRLDLTSP